MVTNDPELLDAQTKQVLEHFIIAYQNLHKAQDAIQRDDVSGCQQLMRPIAESALKVLRVACVDTPEEIKRNSGRDSTETIGPIVQKFLAWIQDPGIRTDFDQLFHERDAKGRSLLNRLNGWAHVDPRVIQDYSSMEDLLPTLTALGRLLPLAFEFAEDQAVVHYAVKQSLPREVARGFLEGKVECTKIREGVAAHMDAMAQRAPCLRTQIELAKKDILASLQAEEKRWFGF